MQNRHLQVVLLLAACLLLPMLLVGPARAEILTLNLNPSAVSWTGDTAIDESPGCVADAATDASQGVLKGYAYAVNAEHAAWAQPWLEYEFVYDHHNHVNSFDFVYGMIGAATHTPGGHNSIVVWVELRDVTGPDNTLLQKRTGTSRTDVDGLIDQGNLSIGFSQLLIEGHTYKLKFMAKVKSWVGLEGGSGTVDFFQSDGQNYYFRLSSASMSHKHDFIDCAGGWGGLHVAEQEFEFLQDQVDSAEKMSIRHGTTDIEADYLAEWYLLFSDMNDCNSERWEDHDQWAISEAWVTSADPVPRGTEVPVFIRHWFEDDPECDNAVSVKEVNWHESAEKGATGRQFKACPDHGWSIHDPVAVPGQPGMYAHRFYLWNDDLTEPLLVRSLVFAASSETFSTPSQMNFGDAEPVDFVLDVGAAPYIFDIITEGEYLDTGIYFSYNLADPTDTETICESWGLHWIGAVTSEVPDVPLLPRLSVHPNPFNPQTDITFTMTEPGQARLQVYSLTGRLVTTLAVEELPAGRYTRTWRGRDNRGRPAPSGTYVVRLVTDEGIEVTKATLVR